jgi:cellulose synthase/poly-beta-1,6-N-acetylglucosamine synthase-like glycosyltransferase
MVPIHNEENSLPSFLRTLMLADIPASIELKILLISNACTDSSRAIIHEFLLSLGAVEEYPLECEWKDEGLNPTCQIVKLNHTTFMHVDSQTPGKANALSIGNSIARRDNCLISMSVDANNYLEPDAIRIMFAHAHSVLYGKLEAGATVLISGNEQLERQNSRFTSVIEQSTKVQRHLVENINGYVLGCFMAWDTEWMHSIGGPPALALEDYALGVLARAQHYTIERARGANIWIYAVNDVSGLLDTRARYVRGMLQLVEFVHRDPSILGILEKEAYYMRHVRARLRHLFLKSKQSPQDFPRYVATFLLWEYALLKGKQEYRQNPTNQSWKKVASTY